MLLGIQEGQSTAPAHHLGHSYEKYWIKRLFPNYYFETLKVSGALSLGSTGLGQGKFSLIPTLN